MSKTYNYKGYHFRRTRLVGNYTCRCLYEILNGSMEVEKEASKRPALTSVNECKSWINTIIMKGK